jgi:hypothetical protein
MKKTNQNNKRKKFRKISFKLSYRQMDIINRYCKHQELTPNKLIKTSIKDYLEKYQDDIPNDGDVNENQLALWDFDAETQMEISFEDMDDE